MNNLFFLIIFASFTLNAQDISGPIGDAWDNKHILNIKKNEKPLYLLSETFLRAEKIVIDRTIFTNGFGLTIEARELVISPNVAIKTFDHAHFPQTYVDTTLKYTTKGGACSVSGTAPYEVGADGPEGLKGLDVSARPHDIKIFATLINGKLNITGDGQQGGKGGKGAMGGKGLDGCKGKNGKADCSGLFGTGDGDPHHGENGKNGARGGYGGKGGTGGRGGENGTIILSFLKLSTPDELKLSSEAGRGGEGGEPGENGLSGKAGPGGDSDKKECGFWPDEETVKAHAGGPGLVISLLESAEQREKRRGLPGESGKQLENAIKVKSFEEIKAERDMVIATVMDFHFARVFYQLIQQSILIVMNQEESLSDAFEFSEINEAAKRKLISDWKEGFIKPLEKEISLNENLRELLISSREMVALLETLTTDQKELVRGKIATILKKQRSSLNQKIKKVAASCRSFINIDSSDLDNKTELFTIPLCYELQQLTNNPMAKLILSKNIAFTTGGISKDDYSYGELNSSSRTPGSSFEVIIINNRKFGAQHFKDLYTLQQRESGTFGALRTLSPLNPDKININNLGSYSRLLREGMKK